MKEIRQTVFELSSRQTDGRTDGRRVILYPPELEFGGIITFGDYCSFFNIMDIGYRWKIIRLNFVSGGGRGSGGNEENPSKGI